MIHMYVNCINDAFLQGWIAEDIACEDTIIEFCEGIPDINGKDKVFMLIELSEFVKYFPLFDGDLDLQFLYHIHKTILQCSLYNADETFKYENESLKGKEVFFLCHTNIRSLKAHINELTVYF